MSIERNKALVRRYVERIWGQRDLSAMQEFEAPDYWRRCGLPRSVHDPAHVTAVLEATYTAFPDYRLEISDMVADGDLVAWRWVSSGTHLGAYMGIEPTGRAVVTTGIAIYRVEDGRISQRWGEADEYGLLQQLGAVPAVVKVMP